MQSARGTVALLVFCVILGVAVIVYVVGRDAPVVKSGAAPASAAKPQPASAPPGKAAEPPGEEALPVPPAPPEQEDLETSERPNPALVVPPVDEPRMPMDEEEGKKFNYLPLPNHGGFIFERPGPGGKPVGGVVVPGHVLVRRGVIELFGCSESGKVHETVIQIETDIQALDTALTLAGLRRGGLPKSLDINDPDQGSRVVVLIQWEDKDGKTVTYRSEDLVLSLKRERPMPRVGWTYVGHWTEVLDPTTPTLERRHKVLACTGTRSLVTTFRDRSALLDNPLPEAEDDTQFAANYMLLPRSGTPVRIIFRAPLEEERKEIEAIEKMVAKAPLEFRPDDRKDDSSDGPKGPDGTPPKDD